MILPPNVHNYRYLKAAPLVQPNNAKNGDGYGEFTEVKHSQRNDRDYTVHMTGPYSHPTHGLQLISIQRALGAGYQQKQQKTCVISFTCESAELVRNEYGTYLQYTKQFKYLTIQEDPRGLYSTWFTNGWVGLPNFFRPGNPGSQSCGQTKTDACLHNTSEPVESRYLCFPPICHMLQNVL